MTYSASVSALESEFNDFLFALIGADRNDVPLSVLSVLARLDIDPWQEAAELTRLPKEIATQRLASSIAELPEGPSYLEHGTIAARLIALLPRQANSESLSRKALPSVDDVTKFRAGICMYAAFIFVMLATQWIAVSRQPPVQIDNANAPTSSTVIPQIPSAKSGQ
jgi:hypothetical protein